MKKTVLVMLMLLLLTNSAFAATLDETARSVVPEGAEMTRTEKDDGMNVYHFRTVNGDRYEVTVDPQATVIQRVEMDAVNDRGGSSVVLTQADAETEVLKLYPEASIHFVTLDKDDGRYSYKVHLSTNESSGWVELNAETGALLESDFFYAQTALISSEASLTADDARKLVLSIVTGGKITEFETEKEDGRTVYEGEVIADGMEIDFTIDAQNGRVTEWETERR
ncbi:MAG: PepSY domain-containing protein [Clostridia bacterium]|nr:PepSY domain-containing protein [Clostridia bacterium]